MKVSYRGNDKTAVLKNGLWYLPLEPLDSLSMKTQNPFGKYRGPFYIISRIRALRNYPSQSLARSYALYDMKYMEFFDSYVTLKNIETDTELKTPTITRGAQ